MAEGLLLKKSTVNRHLWQKRMFVLYPKALAYFKSEKTRESQGKQGMKVILLNDVLSVELASSGKGSEEGSRLNLGMKSARIFELRVDKGGDGQMWRDKIQKCLNDLNNPPPQRPAPLADVQTHEDEEGNVYYFNPTSGVSLWDRPELHRNAPDVQAAAPGAHSRASSSIRSTKPSGGVASLSSAMRRFALMYNHQAATGGGAAVEGRADMGSYAPLEASSKMVLSKTADAVANQLTVKDFDLYSRLMPREFLRKQWTRDAASETSPNILKLVDEFNQRGYWAGSVILTQTDVQNRADALRKIIDITWACRTSYNWFSTYALYNGLSLSAIIRLHKTWELLPAKSLKRYASLKKDLDPAKNFTVYRSLLANVASQNESQIPHLQVVLKDLFSLEEITGVENKELGMEAKLAFHKYYKQYKVLKFVLQCQQRKRQLKSDDGLADAINQGLCSILEEEQLWNLSYEREPKSAAQALELRWAKASDAEKLVIAREQREELDVAFAPIEEARRLRLEKEIARQEAWKAKEQEKQAEEEEHLSDIRKAISKLEQLLQADRGGGSSASNEASAASAEERIPSRRPSLVDRQPPAMPPPPSAIPVDEVESAGRSPPNLPSKKPGLPARPSLPARRRPPPPPTRG